MKSIFNALDNIHYNNIIHIDLKPDNIMIENEADLSSLRLIDFGLSIVNNDSFETDYCGTLKFMAPELIDKKMYNKVCNLLNSVGRFVELRNNYVYVTKQRRASIFR